MSDLKRLLYGRIEGGRLKIDGSLIGIYKLILKGLEGQEIQFTISKKRVKRSGRQNSYYWGVIIKLLSEDWGDIPDVVHDRLKTKFLKYYDNKNFERIWSTADTDFNTKMAEEYYENIRMWAAMEWHVDIPEPNEVDIE